MTNQRCPCGVEMTPVELVAGKCHDCQRKERRCDVGQESTEVPLDQARLDAGTGAGGCASGDLSNERLAELDTYSATELRFGGFVTEMRAMARELLRRRAADAARPRIVCLCGSTRFKAAYDQANYEETCAGKMVLSVGFYPHQKDEHGEEVGCDADLKMRLDRLHFRKIELADEVLILNVGGYVGESTSNELAHARRLGKTVRFLEPEVTHG